MNVKTIILLSFVYVHSSYVSTQETSAFFHPDNIDNQITMETHLSETTTMDLLANEISMNCSGEHRIRVHFVLDAFDFDWTAIDYAGNNDPHNYLQNNPQNDQQNATANKVFTIALATRYDPDLAPGVAISMLSMRHYGSAVTMAIENYCVEKQGLVGYAFNVLLVNDHCNARKGVPAMLELIDRARVDVVFGMACSTVTAPFGFTASYVDLPIISHYSNSPEISDKQTYATVMRMGYSFKYIGQAFVEIVREYGWRRIAGLVVHSSLCDYSSSSVRDAFAQEGIAMPDWSQFTSEGFTNEMIREILVNLKQKVRVIYICMPSTSILARFVTEANKLGMMACDFVFLAPRLNFGSDYERAWVYGAGDRASYTEEQWEARKEPYRHVKIVTTPELKSETDRMHQDELHLRNQQPPLNWNLTGREPPRTGRVLTFYDIATRWLEVVNESLGDGSDPSSGKNVFEKISLSKSTGLTGKCIMDSEGDRISSYMLWQYVPGQERYSAVAEITPSDKKGDMLTYMDGVEMQWATADNTPPLDTPVCGFFNEHCPPKEPKNYTVLILVIVFSIFVVALLASYAITMYIRKRSYDEQLNTQWEIKLCDVEFHKEKKYYLSTRSLFSAKQSRTSLVSGLSGQIFTSVGVYKGAAVAVKRLVNKSFHPVKENLVKLKQVKDLSHENINSFFGLCVNPNNIFIISSYCSKGSLQDVIENEDINLDKSFKESFISDLANGMKYLHESPIGSHGRLRSDLCFVTSRWVLKIGGAGLHWVRKSATNMDSQHKIMRNKLWWAPELLRLTDAPLTGTKSGDVYSFGIIVQEILYKAKPYYPCELPTEEIIEKLKTPPERPFRPCHDACPEQINPKMGELMAMCLQENPSDRPSFSHIVKRIKEGAGRKLNIVDNMLDKLEKYADNLEELVAKRTEELVAEKEKTDLLLYRMLPKVVAEKLKIGEQVAPEIFDLATVFFSDIVGFTTLVSKATPIQVVDLLNDLYTCFDDIIDKHDVYKVETIGDAYMCVSGIPVRNGKRHGGEIANMAIELRSAVAAFRIRHMPAERLEIRIGIHTGSCAAGVVGLTMPRYCLFGDTVNTASRMETNSLAMKIHLTAATNEVLNELGGYDTELRGDVEIKGKGVMQTYWLNGEN